MFLLFVGAYERLEQCDSQGPELNDPPRFTRARILTIKAALA
jgi:hypothetical protein